MCVFTFSTKARHLSFVCTCGLSCLFAATATNKFRWEHIISCFLHQNFMFQVERFDKLLCTVYTVEDPNLPVFGIKRFSSSCPLSAGLTNQRPYRCCYILLTSVTLQNPGASITVGPHLCSRSSSDRWSPLYNPTVLLYWGGVCYHRKLEQWLETHVGY